MQNNVTYYQTHYSIWLHYYDWNADVQVAFAEEESSSDGPVVPQIFPNTYF